jgi:predicted amidohydrolase
VAIILSSPRFNAEKDRYYNAAIFIDEHGQIRGEHYKFNVLPGSEGWSSPGFEVKPITWNGHKIGLLNCSDAYTENIARELAAQGVDVLISPAAWAPGMHEPNGEWEQRSTETGLCMYVCNCTGKEDKKSFEGSASAVISGGRRVFEYRETAGHPDHRCRARKLVSTQGWFPNPTDLRNAFPFTIETGKGTLYSISASKNETRYQKEVPQIFCAKRYKEKI